MKLVRSLQHAVLALACCASAAPALAQSGSAGDPAYDWSFHRILSDGQGGVGDPQLLITGDQNFGPINVSIPLDPNRPQVNNATVWGNATGSSFWTSTFSPVSGIHPPAGAVVGGMSELRVYRSFSKDRPDASLSMTISDLFLRAAAFGGPADNQGLFGSVVFDMILYSDDLSTQLDAFSASVQLAGRGGDWLWSDASNLGAVVTAGSTSGGSISIDLPQAFHRAIDTAHAEVGDIVTVEYRVVTTVWDTVQAESTIQAFGRDPINFDAGSAIVFDGFTPVAAPVPEPAALGLMLLGLPFLAWWARRARQVRPTPAGSGASRVAVRAGLLLTAACTLPAHAALLGRDLDPASAGFEAWYDDQLNITWLAAADLATRLHFGVAGIDTWGGMSRDTAGAWIDAMNDARHLGFSGWRLPRTLPIGGGSQHVIENLGDGSVDVGYSISAPGTVYAGSTASEMAHLYYNTLGNAPAYDANFDPTGCSVLPGYCLQNPGPFSYGPLDVPGGGVYWSSKVNDPGFSGYSFQFDMPFGFQGIGDPMLTNLRAWAVHDGDVLSAVPEPGAAGLAGAGLALLIGWRRLSSRPRSRT